MLRKFRVISHPRGNAGKPDVCEFKLTGVSNRRPISYILKLLNNYEEIESIHIYISIPSEKLITPPPPPPGGN